MVDSMGTFFVFYYPFLISHDDWHFNCCNWNSYYMLNFMEQLWDIVFFIFLKLSIVEPLLAKINPRIM